MSCSGMVVSDAMEYKDMKNSGIEWIGKIPTSWKTHTLYQLVTQVKNKNSDLNEQNLLSLSYGKIKRKDINSNGGLLPESFNGYNIIEDGDIVLRLTDLQNDHTSLRVGRATERGIITSAYTTLRPIAKDSSKYLYYLLHSFDIKKGFYGMGSGVRQGLNYDEVKELRVVMPPQNEQSAIAAYLDEQCAKIDALIAEEKNSIEEYKKWKASLIFEAVTKGLDPNAEMKDSGVEWIGYVPLDWRTHTLYQLVTQVKNKNSDMQEDNLLSLSYGKIKRRDINARGGLLPEAFNGYNIIECNDIVLRLTDLQNDHTSLRVGLAIERGIITSAYTVLRVINQQYAPYLYYLLYAFDIKKGFYGMGSGVRQGLNYDEVKELKVILPPTDEQQAIVLCLDEKIQKIDFMISEKHTIISELEEYKKSLVYEVVTGKRKVV